MSTSVEVLNLVREIRDRLEFLYRKGADYSVVSNDDIIIVRGKALPLSGNISRYMPGEVVLTVDSAKKFLEDLNRVIIINDHMEYKKYITFNVTNGNELVFSYENKMLSSDEISQIYREFEKGDVKDSLPLALDLINIRFLYDNYIDYSEQARIRQQFLQSYNERISDFNGKKSAIDFAKSNRGIWLRIRGVEKNYKDFDITSDIDIVDSVINHEKLNFSYGFVPLEKRNLYNENLENYELRISNLIERLEVETKKVLDYLEKTNAIMDQIASSNALSVKPLNEIPEYGICDMDTILSEEKDKYDLLVKQKREEKYASSFKSDDKDDSIWLSDIDSQQRLNIDYNEKTALMLYKSFMYNLFNNIVSYARKSNLEIKDVLNDSYVEELIKAEYDNYVKRITSPSMVMPGSNAVKTVVDDIFPKGYAVGYDRFRQVVTSNVVLLEGALSKNTLKEPLTVYRCVYLPTSQSVFGSDLGNAFLSTTTSSSFTSSFIDNRAYDINYEANKVIYKIELPEGSPVIAYTDDIFLRNGSSEVGFNDSQKEILIDSSLYDFKFKDSDYNITSDGSYIYSVTVQAVPKLVDYKTSAI